MESDNNTMNHPSEHPYVPQPHASTSSSQSGSSYPSSSSSTASPRRIFPGFLSQKSDDYPYSTESPSSPSSSLPRSSLDSDIGLPYLRDDQPGPSLNRKSPPAPLRLHAQPGPSAHASGSGSKSARGQASGSGSTSANGLFAGPLSGRSTGSAKKRPSPLQLNKSKSIGLDEELSEQRTHDGPLTSLTVISDSPDSLHSQMADLSLLRQSVKQNLIARPVDSPLAPSDSGDSTGALTPERQASSQPIEEDDLVSIHEVVELLSSASNSHGPSSRAERQTFVVDTRPYGDYLQSHLPRSANLSIPSLIFKRFRKATEPHATSWDSLGSFITTPAGKEVWAKVNPQEPVEIMVLGLTAMDEPARVLRRVLSGMLEGRVRIIKGGWAAVLSSPPASELLVQGEQSVKSQSSFAPLRTAPSFVSPPMPPAPKDDIPRIVHHPSLPSLRASRGKPNLPTLSINRNQSKRPPKLSLNLDRPLRSALPGPTNPDGMGRVEVSDSRRHASGSSTPLSSSFQALCHEQSKLPPSPSSFGGVDRNVGDTEDLQSPAVNGRSPWHYDPTSRPDERYAETSRSATLAQNIQTARTHGLAPFIVSTILPGFLYLGPEITSEDEVEALKQLGIRRILNVAIECDNEDLHLSDRFERYMKVPMRDIVEESGVGKGMRDSCKFLDDARLHSAPTYVHCKAGKSRSVTVVLAYLIHANAWTLKTAYAYVAERRKGISPNIGFVAELMQFEEAELGLRQSGGVHGETARGESQDDRGDASKQKATTRHVRDSLPPTWAASMDSGTRPRKVSIGDDEAAEQDHRKDVGDEREVRKNGQWVHQRRAPVDRTTLQPGRRVSKAGLESLRPLATSNSPRPSPKPSPRLIDGSDKPATPGGEGRLGWV